jgi:hypothetical protein
VRDLSPWRATATTSARKSFEYGTGTILIIPARTQILTGKEPTEPPGRPTTSLIHEQLIFWAHSLIAMMALIESTRP